MKDRDRTGGPDVSGHHIFIWRGQWGSSGQGAKQSAGLTHKQRGIIII